jgi:dihydrodipicolinate synthase/N-acetylneuraminate lyase
LISALTTLFDQQGAVDLGATRAAYEQLAESPLDAVFAAGTTGEFVTLTDEERLDVCSAASDAFGADRTYWHVGSASTHQAVQLTQAAVGRGARHLAALTPHYFAATESAVLSYYEAVVEQASGVPVYGYLFPARSTTSITPALLTRIADIGITGVKISGQRTRWCVSTSKPWTAATCPSTPAPTLSSSRSSRWAGQGSSQVSVRHCPNLLSRYATRCGPGTKSRCRRPRSGRTAL